VRVISPKAVQLGVLRTSDALARALESGLDLVEIDPNAHPPVCPIMDFEKYVHNRKPGPPDRWTPGDR
jgi:translation initiation factor IF-3